MSNRDLLLFCLASLCPIIGGVIGVWITSSMQAGIGLFLIGGGCSLIGGLVGLGLILVAHKVRA